MIKKMLLLNLLVYTSSIYSADIENILNKEITIVDILNSDILATTLSHADNLKELNELLGKFECLFPESFKCVKETNKSNADAMRVINQYLENRFKEVFKAEEHEKYYSALKTLSIEARYNKILQLINSAKINPPINKDFQMHTLLNNEEHLIFIIKLGADLNVTNEDGNTAIHLAVLYHNIQRVKLLVNYGADLNIENLNKNTPLALALINENRALVELLILAGAHVKRNPPAPLLDYDFPSERIIVNPKPDTKTDSCNSCNIL